MRGGNGRAVIRAVSIVSWTRCGPVESLSTQSLPGVLESIVHFRPNLVRVPGLNVCNVGIGTGDWDNFLCDLLVGTGCLTSIDIDPEICELFRYRQKREGHPNPSTVVCADVMEDSLPAASFDVVTIIGSTVTESGNYSRCLGSCLRLVRPAGFMMYMDFFQTPAKYFEDWSSTRRFSIVERVDDERAGGYIYWVIRHDG